MKEPVFHRRFEYPLGRLPNAQLRAMEDGVKSIEEARTRSGLTIGYPGWMLIYYATFCTLEREADNQIVETGTNIGCSTIVLAQALIDSGAKGKVTTVEIDADIAAQARANFQAAKVSARIESVVGDAKTALPSVVAKLPAIRVAYLDGCHLHDDVVAEFAAVEPKLTPGAVVIMDNTYEIAEAGEDPRVNGALKTILARWGGNLINFPNVSWFTPGCAIWQRAPFPA